MDETVLGMMKIVGPIILLVVRVWAVTASPRGKSEARAASVTERATQRDEYAEDRGARREENDAEHEPVLPSASPEQWFAARGWEPRRHQLDMLRLARAGPSALLVAATGAGKTLAGFLPTIADLIEQPTEGLHTSTSRR